MNNEEIEASLSKVQKKCSKKPLNSIYWIVVTKTNSGKCSCCKINICDQWISQISAKNIPVAFIVNPSIMIILIASPEYFDNWFFIMLMFLVEDIDSFREYIPIYSKKVTSKEHLQSHSRDFLKIQSIDLPMYEQFVLIFIICIAVLLIKLSDPSERCP